jgi:tetratricopeptide (TPR) repeat protein
MTAPPKIAANVPPPNPPETTAPTAANTPPAANTTFWDKIKPNHWFAPPPGDKKFDANGVTPLPTSVASPADSAGDRPVDLSAFPRYDYSQPGRPAAGDRRAASGSFTTARVFEQEARFVDAMQQYHSAAEFDPSWFDAQYNYAVLCYRLGNYRQALGAYEMTLAIEPSSANARYNFALALKAAGYVPDAINELKRLVATHPDEVRAEAALGSIYAQKVRDAAAAREHYQKVLALDPGSAEADSIRRWLAAHGG